MSATDTDLPGTPVEFNPYDWLTAHNPYPVYRRLRDEAPVYHNERFAFWALSRHADVQAAHADPMTWSSAGGVTIEGYETDSASTGRISLGWRGAWRSRSSWLATPTSTSTGAGVCATCSRTCAG